MIYVRIVVSLIAIWLLGGCQKSHMGVGSESHFLATCGSDADCGRLQCIAGTCTRACTDDDACAALHADGQCMAKDPSAPRAHASQQICGLGCSDDAACAVIGDGLRCEQGQCRLPAATVATPSGEAGSSPVGGDVPSDPRATGAAGSGSSGTAPSSGPPPNANPPVVTPPIEMLGVGAAPPCGQMTGFDGDDACLPPPPPGKGVQIHVGPLRYDDRAELARWTVQPGDEATRCFSVQLPVVADFAFAEWELSARPGLHHSVHNLDAAGDQANICLQLDSAPLPGRPDQLVAITTHVPRMPTAPENATVATRLPAHALAISSTHFFNFTDKPQLLELWLNLYTPDASPTEFELPLHMRGGIQLSVPPGETNLTRYACPIGGSGRLLSLATQMGAGSDQLDALLVRTSGERIPLLRRAEHTPDWAEYVPPLRFDSATSNDPIADGKNGGFSGIVEFSPGDSLQWSCRIDNSTDHELTRTGDRNGALCDLYGSTVGTELHCDLP